MPTTKSDEILDELRGAFDRAIARCYAAARGIEDTEDATKRALIDFSADLVATKSMMESDADVFEAAITDALEKEIERG